MHTVGCYIRLMQYSEEADTVDIIDFIPPKERLQKQIKHSITGVILPREPVMSG